MNSTLIAHPPLRRNPGSAPLALTPVTRLCLDPNDYTGGTVGSESQDVKAVIERLRSQDIDVVRVSYSDMIGIDRGRDVLLSELPAALGHGLPFSRCVYHTSPMGDVVQIQGGGEEGLPDPPVRPDLRPLAPLTLRAGVGPELESFACQPDGSAGTGFTRYANSPGNVYVVGRKGDPNGLLLRTLRYLREARLQVTAAHHEFCAGQFEVNLNHSELVDAADRAFRMKSAVQEIARHDGLLATFMAKPFNDEGGSGFHLHVSLADESGENVFGDP